MYKVWTLWIPAVREMLISGLFLITFLTDCGLYTSANRAILENLILTILINNGSYSIPFVDGYSPGQQSKCNQKSPEMDVSPPVDIHSAQTLYITPTELGEPSI